MNSNISCISTSFKKEISILSYIVKKLQARQFSPNWLSLKAPGTKSFKKNFDVAVDILKTVLVVDLTFKFWIYGQNSPNFSFKTSPKTMFFLHIPDCYNQFCKYCRACNFFATWLWMLFFLMTWIYIQQLILEFNKNVIHYILKIHNVFFSGTCCTMYIFDWLYVKGNIFCISKMLIYYIWIDLSKPNNREEISFDLKHSCPRENKLNVNKI